MQAIIEKIQQIVGYAPSKYQAGVLRFLLEEKGNGACNAVAGSGKSSTLLLAAIALSESGIRPADLKVIVFGKANSEDLKRKLSKLGKEWEDCASTLHATGYALVREELGLTGRRARLADVKSNKYKTIAQALGLISKGPRLGSLIEDKICSESDFLKLVNLVRLTNQPAWPDVIRELASHFEIDDIEEFPLIAAAVEACLTEGEAVARESYIFDYTDMLWLPVLWKLHTRPWFHAYKSLFLDECQDLNQVQLTLALMLVGQIEGYTGTPGRMMAVGDEAQAIMGFSGADCDSYKRIIEQTNATKLPLSICYRCPSSHIKLVQYLFPSIPIEARPNAPDGIIRLIGKSELDKELVEGDMVLCRKTAPLVSLCIQLITRGVHATVKGKDIGETLKRELNGIAKMPGFQFSSFADYLKLYKQAKAAKYHGKDEEEQLLESLNDKMEAIEAIHSSQAQAICIPDLETYIDSLFDDGHSPITLATIHRSKGLENDRVFILEPDKLPLTWKKQQEWQFKQECNLHYVALTRAKRELVLIGDKPDWLPDLSKLDELLAQRQKQSAETAIAVGEEVEQLELQPQVENDTLAPEPATGSQPPSAIDAEVEQLCAQVGAKAVLDAVLKLIPTQDLQEVSDRLQKVLALEETLKGMGK